MRDAHKVWPVLVADLEDPTARDFLEGVALAQGKAYLPLIAAPAQATPHLLEVYTPASREPLRLFAEPLGAPTAVGFPLRLRPFDPNLPPPPEPHEARERPSRPLENPRELKAKKPTKHTLSPRHTQDLRGAADAIATGEALVGRELAGGKLRLTELVGEGRVGFVYKAFHRDLQNFVVAVKVLSETFQSDMDFSKRFHAEALAASKLDHPNLMRVLDYGQESDGLLYIAMEFLGGTDLMRLLRAGEPLSLSRIVDLGAQICAGLAHAHKRGIVHRDVKPDNIMLVLATDDDDLPIERVKVRGFGIAEHSRGEKLDAPSDVRALGVVLYQMASGVLPFTAPPGTIDPRLEKIILKTLAEDPAARPTMRDLRSALRALDEEQPKSPPPPPVRVASAIPELGTSSRAPPKPVASKPAPKPVAARAREPDFDWLDHGGSFERSAAPASQPPSSRGLATELVDKGAPWLAAFVASRRETYEVLASQLLAVIPALVEQRAWKALHAVRSTVDMLAEDPSQPGWRKKAASDLQHALAEGSIAATLADAALASDQAPREVHELLGRVGPPAAYALYARRLERGAEPGVRPRFVTAVRKLGADAMPMIRAALTKLEAKKATDVAEILALDLLRAAPAVRDDAAGEIVLRFVDGTAPAAVTCAATEALVAFWGDRAKPMLLGLLDADDDSVVVCAIGALRTIRGVDPYVARWIERVATRRNNPEVRDAAKAALAALGG